MITLLNLYTKLLVNIKRFIGWLLYYLLYMMPESYVMRIDNLKNVSKITFVYGDVEISCTKSVKALLYLRPRYTSLRHYYYYFNISYSRDNNYYIRVYKKDAFEPAAYIDMRADVYYTCGEQVTENDIDFNDIYPAFII